MNDIKTYIQGHLKMHKDLDMSSLIDACGISRAKFYKCLKEPWRFDTIDLDRIADKMNLDENDRRVLISFKNSNGQGNPFRNEDNADLENVEELYGLVEGIIVNRNSIVTDRTSKMFTLLREKTSEQPNVVCCADELAEEIYQDLCVEDSADQKPLLDIKILNVRDGGMINVVFSLFQSLNRYQQLQRTGAISAVHYMPGVNTPQKEHLALYAEWHQMMEYSQYQMKFTDEMDNTIFEMWNGCVIRYHDREKRCKYLVLNILAKNNAVAFSFSDGNLFEFLRYNCAELFEENKLPDFLSTDVMVASTTKIESKNKYQTIEFAPELCLDHLLSGLFEELLAGILHPCSKWDGYDKLLNVANAHSLHAIYGKAQTLRSIFDSFKQRFEADRQMGTIHLLTSSALKHFADNGQNIDMSLVDLYFNQNQIIRQLEYIKNNLGGLEKKGSQHFYLVDSSSITATKAISIYRNRCVAMTPFDTVVKGPYYRMVMDSDIANIFYEFIVERLLNEDRNKMCRLRVLKKTEAEAFINKLINDVNNRNE